MTGDQYVEGILAKYRIDENSAKRAAESVAPALRNWAGAHLAELSYSGSFAKGTANNLSTDVDLFISLRSDTPGNLRDNYNSLFQLANEHGWSPIKQNVSIGISYAGKKLDLVPGRRQSGYQHYHSLYRRKADSWTQTNVKLHIDKVSQSGRRKEIRAVKVWRELHGLDFPSFFLELVVIEALKGKSTQSLASNVLTALNYIGKALSTVRVVDPANTNNAVSDDLSQSGKTAVASQARSSAAKQYWKDIIW
jgi:hypothetical protein